MKFDTQKYSYASRRTVSFAKNGMVATSSPLPAQVGLDVLKKGGNAIDAAVATAAALSVIEPTSNGIGADSFALIWYKGKLYGLNGSGRSPRLISGEKLLEKGLKAVPSDGWDPVMVPGTPSAWASSAICPCLKCWSLLPSMQRKATRWLPTSASSGYWATSAS